MSDGSYRISVVIPTYQRRASLQRVLSALARQTLVPDDYEVIISIDGSRDGTREMIAMLSTPYALRALWQPNRGRAAACNSGIRAARGQLLVVLDDDMEPVPEFLDAHWQAHDRLEAGDSRAGVLGAVPIQLDPSSSPIVEYIAAKFAEHQGKLARPDYALVLRDFYTGNFSICRKIMLEVGGFDEAFKMYGNEDLELSLRLSQAGVRFVFSPHAAAWQHFEKNFATVAKDNIAKGHTAVLLATKHHEVFGDLRLSTYRQGSRKWRLLRAGLLQLSQLTSAVPRGVIYVITWLEKRRPKRLPLIYRLALDYFFWVGANSALREQHRSLDELRSWSKV